jgi:ankyrin repeat protein
VLPPASAEENGAVGAVGGPHELIPLIHTRNHASLLPALRNSGTSVLGRTGDGQTPLVQACLAGDVKAVTWLIAAGAHPLAAESDGTTPLLAACSRGVPKENGAVTRAVVSACRRTAGAAGDGWLETTDRVGRTPLLSACASDQLASVRVLLAAGANVNAADRRGETALMMAAALGNKDVVEALLLGGADIAAKSAAGGTASSLAGSDEISLLIDAFAEELEG